MRPKSHFQPPRQSVVYGYTRRLLDETATNANSFAMAVAERYLSSVAPDVRNVPFRLGEGDELIAALKHNGQILRRFMDGTVKVLPADVEDAWVMALPEPYRSECERDLARRRGRFTFAVSESLEGEEFGAIGEVLSQVGELSMEWGKALADGMLTDAEALRIDAECRDVIAAVLRVQHCTAELRTKQVVNRL